LLGLSPGEVLPSLMETGEGRPDDASIDPAEAEEGPVLRLRMPDGRVEREPPLGGFWRPDEEGGLTSPPAVTRREGGALACKLYRVEAGPGGGAFVPKLAELGRRRTLFQRFSAADQSAASFRHPPPGFPGPSRRPPRAVEKRVDGLSR
jgi:hypothetical protein